MDNLQDLPSVGEGTYTYLSDAIYVPTREFKSEQEALEVFRKTAFLHIGVKDNEAKA